MKLATFLLENKHEYRCNKGIENLKKNGVIVEKMEDDEVVQIGNTATDADKHTECVCG